MKKHSPNFHTNLEEADKAKNNRASTFFWTVVLVTTLMLGFSLTSTAQGYELGVYRVPPEHDTIPVKMVVSDSSSNVLQILNGYQSTDAVEPNFAHTHTLNQCNYRTYKTTYLNHKKQPLPDRIIVWMAIRRNEK